MLWPKMDEVVQNFVGFSVRESVPTWIEAMVTRPSVLNVDVPLLTASINQEFQIEQNYLLNMGPIRIDSKDRIYE